MPTPLPDPSSRNPVANQAHGSGTTPSPETGEHAAQSDSTGSHRTSSPDPAGMGPDILQMLDHPGASPIGLPLLSSANTDDAPTVITRAHSLSPQPTPLPVAGDAPSIAGRRLGHFELIESIGSGGMAAVLKAVDLELGRVVALKILPPETARDPECLSRFKQEARAAAMLDHENIARAYFCGEDQGLHFIAFEFVEGENLRQLIDRLGTIPVADCIPYMIQIASGLTHAAERGVVHRDIKPSNILITPDGRAKIVDMGLARRLDDASGGVTHSGVTLGTFDYISPEQALDPRRADVRSDIYSLGCAFYHALTGRPPVPEGTAARKLQAHQQLDPLDPRELNPAIPDELAAILAGMMAKDPAKRYQHPATLIAHLKGVAERLKLSMAAVEADSTVKSVPASTSVLPEPPRMRVGWVAAISAAAIAIAALVLSNGNPNPRGNVPNWSDPPGKRPGDSIGINGGLTPNTTHQPADGVVLAHNVEEFVEALAKPTTTSIHLDPTTYDLTGHSTGIVFTGKSLELVGTTSPAGSTRIVVAAARQYSQKTPPSPGHMVVKSEQFVARGIRFEARLEPGTESPMTLNPSVPPFGLLIHSAQFVNLADCTLGCKNSTEALAATVAILSPPDANPVRIRIERCAFGTLHDHQLAGIGLYVPVRSEVTIEDSGFGPHLAAIQIHPPTDEAEPPPISPPVPTAISLLRSSFMLEPNCSVVTTPAPVTLTAGHSVFSFVGAIPAAAGSTGVLIHALEKSDGVKYTGYPRNAYYRVAPLAVRTGEQFQSYSFEQCRTDLLPIADAEAVVLARRPWAEEQPLEVLGSPEPWRAFALDSAEPRLSLPDRKIAILGAQFHVAGTNVRRAYAQLYWPPANLPKTAVMTEERTLVWHPDGDENNLPRDTFTDLGSLLRIARAGDKVLIRHDGLLPVDRATQSTVELKPRAGVGELRLTFKPFPGTKPILATPGGQVLDQTLFKLMSGEVWFEDLQFLLKPSRPRNPQMLAVVTIVGGKTCHFTRCVFTLAEDEDARAAAVLVADPERVMAMDGTPRPTPDVRFDRCLIRGKGRGVWAPVSRAVKLEAVQSIAALDGPFFLGEAGAKQATGPKSSIKLQRSTVVLGGAVIELKASELKAAKSGEMMMRAGGLNPIDVETDECLFAAIAGTAQPLVELDGLDAADAKVLLTWQVRKANRYANLDESTTAMIARPQVDGSATKEWTWMQWLDFAGEPPAAGKPIGKVRFERPPVGIKDLALLCSTDLLVKEVDFPDLGEPKPGDAGADVKLLPPVWDEPKQE